MLPIEVTEVPIVTDVIPEQSLNVETPIARTKSGMVIDCNTEQFWNAELPIEVTEFGILIDGKINYVIGVPYQSVSTVYRAGQWRII